MKKRGIENVRGGAFSRIDLNPVIRKHIQSRINHNDGACLKCGESGHWVHDCTKEG
jgi:hypothetical protein